MPSTNTDPAILAVFLKVAVTRFGELGQPAIDAFDKVKVARGEFFESDAGVELLETWCGSNPADRPPATQDPHLPPVEGVSLAGVSPACLLKKMAATTKAEAAVQSGTGPLRYDRAAVQWLVSTGRQCCRARRWTVWRGM